MKRKSPMLDWQLEYIKNNHRHTTIQAMARITGHEWSRIKRVVDSKAWLDPAYLKQVKQITL